MKRGDDLPGLRQKIRSRAALPRRTRVAGTPAVEPFTKPLPAISAEPARSSVEMVWEAGASPALWARTDRPIAAATQTNANQNDRSNHLMEKLYARL